MNCFKLIMSQCNCYQRRELGFMKEPFPSRKARLNLAGWRRDERGIRDFAARWANPVLNSSEQARAGMMSWYTRHEFLVQFAYESNTERKLLQPRDSMFQSNHIVANLPEIFGTAIYRCPCFSGEQLTERGLGTLNLAGKDSLASDERWNKNVRVGKASPPPRQSADEAICV